mgnify:FL=1
MEIYGYIFLEALLCLILATIIIYFYVRKGTNPIVILSAIFSWFLNFFMVGLLPYDICLTNKLKTNSELTKSDMTTSQIIKLFYKLIYWLIFFCSWILLPILKKYESCGEFTKWDKFIYSIRSNLILYGILLLICIVLFIWAYIKLEQDQLSFFRNNIYNFNYIYGLSIVLLLLSYSLIKLPIKIYEKINYLKTIQYYEYSAKNINDKLTVVKTDLEENGYLLLSTIEDSKVVQEMKDDNILSDSKKSKSVFNYQKYMKEKFDYLYKNSKIFDIEIKKNSFGSKEEPIRDPKKLVQLNKKIINGEWDNLRLQCQIQKLYSKWCLLKSILVLGKKNKYISSKYNKIGQDKSEQIVIDRNDESFITLSNISSFKVWYYLKIRKTLIFLLTIILFAFGGIIFISEITISLSINLSLFGFLIKSVTNVLILHLVLLVQIIYLFGMSMYTLFKLKISGYYGMYSHRQTDSASLMFFSENLCSIIFPLCLNVIMMVNPGKNKEKTILENIFGIDVRNKVFLIFNNFSPLILILFLLINGFNVFTRLGKCFGIDDFDIKSEKRDNDIEEGHELLMNLNRKNMGQLISNIDLQQENSVKSSVNIDFNKI